jgi:hypothetical protein
MRTQRYFRPVCCFVRANLTLPVALGIALLAEFLPAIAGGEDIPAELPKDGAWVRYDVEFDNPERKSKVSSEWTFTMVGTVIEDGKTCRWVEIKNADERAGQPGKVISKMLIPESAFLEPGNPAERMIRCWMTKPDGSVVMLPIFEPAHARRAGVTYEKLFLWTPGARKNLTQIDEPKDFDYQGGRLNGAQAWTGKTVLTDAGVDRKSRWETTYTVWQHPDLALGSAQIRVRQEGTTTVGTSTTQFWVYRLKDTGTGAKTELPDNQ